MFVKYGLLVLRVGYSRSCIYRFGPLVLAMAETSIVWSLALVAAKQFSKTYGPRVLVTAKRLYYGLGCWLQPKLNVLVLGAGYSQACITQSWS